MYCFLFVLKIEYIFEYNSQLNFFKLQGHIKCDTLLIWTLCSSKNPQKQERFLEQQTNTYNDFW